MGMKGKVITAQVLRWRFGFIPYTETLTCVITDVGPDGLLRVQPTRNRVYDPHIIMQDQIIAL